MKYMLLLCQDLEEPLANSISKSDLIRSKEWESYMNYACWHILHPVKMKLELTMEYASILFIYHFGCAYTLLSHNLRFF